MEDIIKEWLQYSPLRIKPPRHSFYPLTVDLIISRMKTQLPINFLKNQKVLDLGCCIPFNEIWCNIHGAKLYHGVEVLKEIADKSKKLVKNQNKIFHDSIENFIKENDISFYDTIIAQSSLNACEDVPGILKKLFASKSIIILESTDKTPGETKPLIHISNTSAAFDSSGSKVYDTINWHPNLASMKILAEIDQYDLDDAPNRLMKLKIPDWSKHKFACWLSPSKNKNTYFYMKDYEKNEMSKDQKA